MPFAGVDIRKRLASNVRRLRKAEGISQEELAYRAGIHRTYASDLERGVRNPTIRVVDRLATALKVGPARLFD